MSLKRKAIGDWIRSQNIEADKVVDIGIGVNPVKRWIEEIKFKEYITVDIQDKFNPNIILDIGKEISFYEIEPLLDADCVFLIETLEHILDPLLALKNINKILKVDGILYLTVPFVNPIHDDWDFYRFTKEGIESLVLKAGFIGFETYVIQASEGSQDLRNFYAKEGLRISKSRLMSGYESSIFDIEYCLKAYK